MKRLCVLWMIALLPCNFAWSAQVPPEALTKADVQSLVRISQLSEWIGLPVALSTGLCVQANYAGAWPQSGLNGIPQRSENLLQQAWETCNTTEEGLRLVKQMREILQSQIRRLAQPYAALSKCQRDAAPGIDIQKCFAAAFGRPLNKEEQRMLLVGVRIQ